MDRTQWREFLELWSAEWIAAHDPEHDRPAAPEVLRSGWLGFGAASEAQVAAAEARLGCRLPPSLRQFLLVTDGWRDTGGFVYRLAGTAELDWLSDTPDRHWADGWEGTLDAEVFGRSLRLSLEGDLAVMLLDPQDVDEHGEWAGYWHATWTADRAERSGSFAELMRSQWASFHALRQPPGVTRDHWDAEVERGRHLALAGETEQAVALFARARSFGRRRAEVLTAQLGLLSAGADWPRQLDNLLNGAHRLEGLLTDPLFAEELLPLLVPPGRAARPTDQWLLTLVRANAPEPVRTLITEYEARAAAPGLRLRFGTPEFDAAVHAVLDRLLAVPACRELMTPKPTVRADQPGMMYVYVWTGPGECPEPEPEPDPAELRAAVYAEVWPDLLDAMRLWRPVSPDHVAPVSLLAHPVLADLLTPERGHRLLGTARGPASGATGG
ncbi:SMI1/KNR4 family protein [Kitasatospora sp. NPDC096147]|uniref:SMI1/KNR4 family protein n=1 Tax=Kitasatospora sp. NPDC096147 TaxID=3364093 RepID=UPI00380FFB9E